MNVDIIECEPLDSVTTLSGIWCRWIVRRCLSPPSPDSNQNYPNAFNATTAISYQLAEVGHVSLKGCDIAPRPVETLVGGFHQAGAYTITWDASDVSSGVYFYKLTAGISPKPRR